MIIGGRLAGLRALALTVATVAVVSCRNDPGLPDRSEYATIMAEASGDVRQNRWRDDEVRRAVRRSFEFVLYLDSVHKAEILSRWQRPALSAGYLLRDESFIGGEFPAGTAKLLRECQRANRHYLVGLREYPEVLRDYLGSSRLSPEQVEVLVHEFADTLVASRQRWIQYFERADTMFNAAAELYELAARYPSAFVAARGGLEINNGYALRRFNALVLEVNRALEAANAALQQLNEDEKLRVATMRLATLAARRGGS